MVCAIAWFSSSWLAIVAGCGFAGVQPRAIEDAPAEICGLLDDQVAAWNRGDLDGFLETYWHSPKLVFLSGGDRTEGFEATRERYRKRYQAEGRAMGRLEFTEIEVEVLGPDSAFARGRWALTMPDGMKPSGLFTLILRKLPEGWRIVHDHTSVAEKK